MSQQKNQISLAGKVAVVTGGTRGIGRAIAASLLAEGARVAICGAHRNTVDEALETLAPRGEIFGAVADVSKLDEVRQFMAAVERRFSTAHILVNNAGSAVFRSTADLEPEEWDRMLALNLSGVYYCCHEILPIFRKNAPGGDVINISSLAGRNPFAGGAGYNASKFGVAGFSEAMMLDHRHEDIRVSCIMPGSVDTTFAGSSEGAGWKVAPEDVAEVVLTVLKMARRTTISRVEMRPSMPPGKQ